MRWKKAGRFGNVPVAPGCLCDRKTLDSDCITVVPVGVSVGGLWQVYFCCACGGVGAVNVSCEQKILEVHGPKTAPTTLDLWQRKPRTADE
jgi:hypothetical protein